MRVVSDSEPVWFDMGDGVAAALLDEVVELDDGTSYAQQRMTMYIARRWLDMSCIYTGAEVDDGFVIERIDIQRETAILDMVRPAPVPNVHAEQDASSD